MTMQDKKINYIQAISFSAEALAQPQAGLPHSGAV
jgi:hypothetical protein